jgi:FAD:protein FMN transferase
MSYVLQLQVKTNAELTVWRSSRLLKNCHCERFSAKQSFKIEGLLRQKTPRNDDSVVFQHLAKRWLPLALVVLLSHNPAVAQQNEPQLFEVSASKYQMGTQVKFKALHTDILACKKAFFYAFEEINRIENLLSYSRDGSEIAAINRAAGVAPVKVSQETFAIIQRSANYAAQFNGIFDISIGPITTLWGFSDEKEITIPPQQELTAKLKLVDYRRIVLKQADTTVFLQTKGMRLDLGGIAKGYAIDRAAAVLKAKGVTHFFVDAGGDIYAAGYKFGEQNWTVGIQHPRQPDSLLATFEGHDLSVATSGDYERYKIIDGQRYHHIIDPRTGFPATLTQSVTVFANTAEEADAWATYLFIIGTQNFEHTPTPPEIKACFVEASGRIKYDPSLVTDFHLHFLTDVACSELTRN